VVIAVRAGTARTLTGLATGQALVAKKLRIPDKALHEP